MTRNQDSDTVACAGHEAASRRISSCKHLLAVILYLFVFAIPSDPLRAETQAGHSVDITPPQVMTGQTTTVKISGFKYSVAIVGVEVAPTEGIFIEETMPTEGDGLEARERARRWSITLTVDSDAKPGDRTITMFTSSDAIFSTTIHVADHLPTIYDLEIVSVRSQGKSTLIDFKFLAEDEKSDLDLARGQSIAWVLLCCQPPFTASSRMNAIEVEDAGGAVAAYVRIPLRLTRAKPAGPCELGVTIFDNEGNRSKKEISEYDFGS